MCLQVLSAIFLCHLRILRETLVLIIWRIPLIVLSSLSRPAMSDICVQRIETSPSPQEDTDPPCSCRLIFRPELVALGDDPNVGKEALRRKGIRNGRMDMPPCTYEKLDDTEEEIVRAYFNPLSARIAGYLADYRRLDKKLKDLDKRLFRADTSSSNQTVTQSDIPQFAIVQRARSDIDNAITEYSEKVRKSLKRACRAKTKYDKFIKKNKLKHYIGTQSGEHRSLWWKALWWLVLVVIVLIEIRINGFFFAAQAGGQLDRWIQEASLISAVNVGLFGFLIMICCKYLLHPNKTLKAWACTGLIVFCFFALTFNLGAAHYRDAIPRDFPADGQACYIPDQPSQEALCLLGTNFAHLAEFQAFGFFLLGLGFILLGVIDWMHLFPDYSGYTNARRYFHNAEEALDKDRKFLHKKIQQIYSAASLKCPSKIEEEYASASEIVQHINHEYKCMISYADAVEELCRSAIEIYRSSNTLARENISNIPSHWSLRWEPSWKLPNPPRDFNLCSSRYAEFLSEREQVYVKNNLEDYYGDSVKKVDALAAYPEESTDTGT